MSREKSIFDVVQTPDSFDARFSSTMENIDDVCERSTQYLQAHIQDIKKHLFSVNLVLREGLTNAVRHGNAGDPEKMVRILLTIFENKTIKLTIQDEGDGFDWKKQQSEVIDDDKDHGRGINIIKTYFSRYSYNDKGNILFLEKDISS